MKLSDWSEDLEIVKEERDWLVGAIARVGRALVAGRGNVDVTIDGRSVVLAENNYTPTGHEHFYDPYLVLGHVREYLRLSLEYNEKLFGELGVEVDVEAKESERQFIEQQVKQP